MYNCALLFVYTIELHKWERALLNPFGSMYMWSDKKKKKKEKKNYVWKSYKRMIRALHKSYVTIALNSTGALPVAK